MLPADTQDEAGFAFYYPGWIWRDPDWLKNLLLFFDGVALLVPEYMRDRPSYFDPAMVSGLEQEGLLKILEPESFISRDAAERLTTGLVDIVESGALDALGDDGEARRSALSFSRLGRSVAPDLADELIEKLKIRGLAGETEDGVSIPLHPLVYDATLVLLAQILRDRGREVGLALRPATDRPQAHKAVLDLLGIKTMPSTAHVVSLDLQTVGVDVASVPLDEVLGFRAEHGEAYRSYAKGLREFVRMIGPLTVEEQQEALSDPQEELRNQADHLKEVATRAWRRPASLALALGGAAWTAITGDVVGGVIAGGGLLTAAIPDVPPLADAYSYLLRASGELP